MSRMLRFRLAIFCSLLAWATFARTENEQKSELDRQFQSAVAQYDAGKFVEAASQLEDLLPRVPNSFEVEELLGLTYSSMSQDAKAIKHLEAAVRLKPDSVAARTNLATSLSRSGNAELAGVQFRKAFELEPRDYTANHNLGEFYAQAGKIEDARPFLERAHRINPSAYDNGYDLAMADLLTGRLGEGGGRPKLDANQEHRRTAQPARPD